MECILNRILILKNKIHIVDREQNPVFAKTCTGFLRQSDARRLRSIQNHLKASRKQKFFDVFQTVNVSSCAYFNINVAIDVSNRIDILFMLIIAGRQVKNNDLVNSTVVV